MSCFIVLCFHSTGRSFKRKKNRKVLETENLIAIIPSDPLITSMNVKIVCHKRAIILVISTRMKVRKRDLEG